jgi:energy-coupling factor transport system ATP-binding protein
VREARVLRIIADGLGYVYNDGSDSSQKALEDVSLELAPGTGLGIIGATASGKSTLVKILNGLLLPTSGRVTMNGISFREWGPELKKRVGLVFQRPERQFFEETVYDDISYVLRLDPDLEDGQVRLKTQQAARTIGLDLESVQDLSPWELGDSDKRKAAIACLLVNDPEVLILDEPLVGLDPQSKNELVEALERLRESRNISLVIVSHDMEDFFHLLHRVLALRDGRVFAWGTPWEVVKQLRDEPGMNELAPRLHSMILDLMDHPDIVKSGFRSVDDLHDRLREMFNL